MAVGVSMTFALAEGTFAVAHHGDSDLGVGLFLLWFLIGGLCSAALVWRTTRPVLVCLATAALGVAFPVGWFAPLLALTWVISSQPWRWAGICAAATALATAAGHVRDLRRDGDGVIFAMTDAVSGEVAVLHPVGALAVGAATLGTAVAVGLVRRYRQTARQARAAELEQTRTADTLRSELSRQDERELIAREMHDTVAHHLSLVSLQASALEVTAGDPATDAAQSARAMRSSAQRALDEMRTLISSLRDSQAHLDGEDYSGPTPTLADLPALVDEARTAGAQIAATVFVTDADAAPPGLTRAVYRIVQEALTNALKHAPGAGVAIDARAAPGTGVEIIVRNALPAGPGADPVTGGAGVLGMTERAEALGGTLRAGPDGELFVVHARLPWAEGPPY